MFIPMPFVNGSKMYSISINTENIYCIFAENTYTDIVIKTVELGVFGTAETNKMRNSEN